MVTWLKFLLLPAVLCLCATTLSMAETLPEGTNIEHPDLHRYAGGASTLAEGTTERMLAGLNAAEATRGEKTTRRGEQPGVDWHKYLGYSTVGLALAAGPANGQKSLHYGLAYSAAAAAVAAVISGYLQHGDEVRREAGIFEQTNRHALLATLGALAIVTSVAVADSGDNGGHSAIGIGGASAMLVSIIDLRW